MVELVVVVFVRYSIDYFLMNVLASEALFSLALLLLHEGVPVVDFIVSRVANLMVDKYMEHPRFYRSGQ